MKESFLHYIWQFQYFDKANLQSTTGDPITIFATGSHNHDAGPDFLNARIRIGEIDWVGSVEIHLSSSGWIDHKHNEDAAYDNVILHVVWNDDIPVQRSDGTAMPTIQLKSRVAEDLLFRYKKLIGDPEQIPCRSQIARIPMVTRVSMLDKVLLQRLETKAATILSMLERNGNSWEETAYQALAKNFGFKVNSEPFERLAKTLPYKLILKHADQRSQVEALLFGQAGFLEKKNVNDEYYRLLQREYHLLATKYSLFETKMNVAQWKYLRLRPSNFPTVRLAQFAALLAAQKNIFSRIVESDRFSDVLRVFRMETSEYWHRHYQFDDAVQTKVPDFGESSLTNLLINSVAPLLAAFGKCNDDDRYMSRAVDILQHLKPEDNVVTKMWRAAGLEMENAFDSQAYLELYNQFCLKRRCLDCNIGYAMLRPT